MASALSQLRAFTRIITASPLKIGAPIHHDTRRRYCTAGSGPDHKALADLLRAVSPCVVALQTYFDHPLYLPGTGVFVTPRVIITSASSVGVFVGKCCEIGRTAAITAAGKVVPTRPLGVNFNGDLALLLAAEDQDLPPSSLPFVGKEVEGKEHTLTVITRHELCDDTGVVQITPTWMEDRSLRTEWSELEHPEWDGFGWARYGSVDVNDVRVFPGSPWFTIDRQLVGISSKAVGNEPFNSNAGFVVPPSRIQAMAMHSFVSEGLIPDHVSFVDPWIEDKSVYGYYDDPHIQIEDGTVRRCGFVSTTTSSDPRLSILGSIETKVKIGRDGKLTATGGSGFSLN